MSDSNYLQANFLGGEWSPFAQGRSDTPDYRKALNVCRNGFPIEEGAWLRRSGTRFAQTTRGGVAGRVMSLSFSQDSPYILELTASAMRMFGVATQSGGLTSALPSEFRLVTTNDNQQVLAISTADPAVVQTNSATSWATNDELIFLFDDSADTTLLPLLRNRVFIATKVDTTHFSLKDSITGATIDGSTLGWPGGGVTAGQLVVARVLRIATSYSGTQWSTVRKVQAETKSIFLHGSYLPWTLTVDAAPTSTTFATFTNGSATLHDGPYLDPPTDGSTITPSAKTGSVTLTASAATAINGGDGFQTTDIGRLVRLLSEPPAWDVSTSYSAGDSVTFNGAYFTCITANTGGQPDISIAYWTINTSAATWSWAKITARASTTAVTATIMGVDLLYTGAMSTWRMGVYSDTTGYPTCGVYYEGRLWLSGAVDNRVDASIVGGVYGTTIDMTPTAGDGTISDASAISYIFDSDEVNPIYWMIGVDTGIVCGTQHGEWLIRASQLSDPITPTSIQAHEGTTYGSENIEPEKCQLTLSFVQRYGRTLLEYFPDVFSGKFTAPNLTQRAKHLTIPGMSEIRYQQELLPIIWVRLADGSLVGCTYERNALMSSQGPDFYGWHRHDLGSGRTVQSIAVGPSEDGDLDTLAIVTNDSGTNIRHVELMQSIFDVNTDITLGWFVDDAVVPSGGDIQTAGGVSTLTFYGLWHLNGETVDVSCGGIDVGTATVTTGAASVNIDASATDLFTTTYLATISSTTDYGNLTCQISNGAATYYVPAMIGYTYTSQGQILRPDAIDQIRSPTGPGMAKPRRNQQIGVLLAGSQGVSLGANFTNMHTANFKTPRGTAYTLLELFSGIYWDTVEDTWSFDGMLCWQITRPYPCAVVALTGFLNTTDR